MPDDQPIKNILVTTLAPMEMHRANSGQNQLGNATAIKRRPDGRVYISGQMQRHALFSAIDRLNGDPSTYVSNGDGTSYMVERDLRADLGGFLLTEIPGEAGRRTSPISATPAVATEKSNTVRDLLLRLSAQDDSQNIATMELSQEDVMRAAYSLDCTALSASRRHTYEAEATDKGIHVASEVVHHVEEGERMRRAQLFLKATRFVNDHASQARNATSAEPQQVLVALDTVISRKASRYFQMSETERKRLLDELEDRGASVFIGDDTDEEKISVHDAYQSASEALQERGLAGEADAVLPYAATYEAMEELREEA